MQQPGVGQYPQQQQMADCDTPRCYCNIDSGVQNGWTGQQLQDTEVVYDSQKARGHLNGRQNMRQGRRSKGYRRLWEQVKSVGLGDALDADGRALNMCEWSVEVCSAVAKNNRTKLYSHATWCHISAMS
jgi:hypothetical protein